MAEMVIASLGQILSTMHLHVSNMHQIESKLLIFKALDMHNYV